VYKQDVFTLSWLALVMVFIITIGILCGHASSSVEQQNQKNLTECLDRGGNIKHVERVGDTCVVEGKK
jgi:hypothetical protein